MNAIPDNTLRLSQGETDNGPVYHANTGLDPLSLCPATGSPQTALARNLEEALNINAEPTTPRASIPQNGDLRHTSLWPDKSHELMRIKDEQLEPNPAQPPYSSGEWRLATPLDNDASSTEVDNHYRLPGNVFSLLTSIDQAPDPLNAAIGKVNRWRASLPLVTSDAVDWRQLALTNIDTLHQLSLSKEKDINSINEINARIMYCMDVHYESPRIN
ncbi:hypothetical protein [Candidatus Sodalis sp. SoCistrobi]|uniref:hypothetical protein n=1 Tax=Candidatus Sodalis sp. SoCistrobi TaxID=1922216 RepID=UPI000F778750|nr:hypothetical protein [Candidatus Sodalis sp. SoCistrobi]